MPIADIAISGVADTILLAAAVFITSMLIKRDIAMRLLPVMTGLVVASLLSRLSGFIPVIRLIDTVAASMPVILAVVFQSDLRRWLLALGKKKTKAPEEDEITATAEEIIKALANMAKNRIGALIVIIRQNPLDNHLEIGTEIDAKVTSELLNSIFLPYSPIHDGAVIIDSGKITRAGCLLPLSENPDISKSFGTRHRAALGLSEHSDALILVLSEETGKISTVHDGKISYDVKPTDLKRTLKRALDPKHHHSTEKI